MHTHRFAMKSDKTNKILFIANMAAIEEILWNVFTYYSLNGNPRDPSRLHSSHLNRFCKDVMAMDSTMTEYAITSPELYLIYTAALTNPNRVSL